jgi:hypothetical protein
MHRAGGVEIALAVGPHAAEEALGRHDRVQLSGLLGGDEAAIVDADGLEHPVGRLQPFPAVGRSGHRQAAGHVQADILTRFLLDLGQKVDRVGLKRGHVGVRIQRVKPARRVPAGARRQHRTFQEADIGPAEFRQVVEYRGAHDAAADDHDAIVVFHIQTSPDRAHVRAPLDNTVQTDASGAG